MSARLRRFLPGPLALAVVVLPTLLAAGYYGMLAADIYVSEARFVVRSPQRDNGGGMGEFFQRVGFARAQDDTYSVRDFMLSRDALKRLDEGFDLREVYGAERADFLARFPWIDRDNSFEALHKYYLARVRIDIDPLSSISAVRVEAFDPEAAVKINEQLLQEGEQFINQLNERGRQDLMRFAAGEVELAEKKAREAALAVREFRNRRSVFDPERQSQIDMTQISKLQDELISTRTQLSEVLRIARNNPKVRALNDRVAALEREIASATAKVSGPGTSLSNKSAEYERLALDREFADKQLAAALASLEQARNEAQRKQLYLERIAQPSRPDEAVLPKRLKSVAATLAVGLASWGVLAMLVAGVREHRD